MKNTFQFIYLLGQRIILFIVQYIKFLFGLTFFPYIFVRILLLHLLYHSFLPTGLVHTIIVKSLDIYHQKVELRNLQDKIKSIKSKLDMISRDDVKKELVQQYMGTSFSSNQKIILVKRKK